MSDEDRFAMAVEVAAKAHRGQIYKGYGDRLDEPYILHLLRVALAVTPRARVVAILHDVFEDTPTSFPGFLTEDEVAALLTLTRRKGEETYEEYIQRICTALPSFGNIAREVKRADLLENLANNPPEHLRVRYLHAYHRLTGASR